MTNWPDTLKTLERIRDTEPTFSNLGDLINAVAFVCTQVKEADVSVVQDLLDEAYMVLDRVTT